MKLTDDLVILNEGGEFVVKDIGNVYPSHSVLAGQTIIQFVDSFDTLEEAEEAYPNAVVSNHLLVPRNTYDHLPDDADY